MSGPLYVVRHSPVAVEGICYGQFSVPVSLAHDDAAERIAEALSGKRPNDVWTSDLGRCRAPAELVACTLDIPLRIDKRLREISMGHWEGRTWEEIERSDATRYANWMNNWTTQAPPDGDSLGVFEARVRQWHNDLTTDHGTLLIAHAGVVRALLVVRRGLDWTAAMKTPVPHLTLITV